MNLPINLQSLYKGVIAALHPRLTLRKGSGMKWVFLIAVFSFTNVVHVPSACAWRWDEDEAGPKDELDIQLDNYRKKVEQGMPLQERIVMLDRLIKLYKIRKKDTKALENERAQVLADEQAVQTVSAASRQKAQQLFQEAFESVQKGDFKKAHESFMEAERTNPTDKTLSDLRQKMGAIVDIVPQVASAESASGDLVLKGVMQFLQNEPSKSINFLLYAQQKDPKDANVPLLLDLVKRTFPNESSEILDARLNLIDQKLQKALEKIYSGEYLIAAKECQEVLDLEPENPLALTRLGSVYYAMGQVKQAREYWKQALERDPKNDVLKSFMSQTSAEADRAPSQALTYKVQKGDTLMIIAERIYKDKEVWRKLYDANKAYLKNPYALAAGQVLVLPPGAVGAP